MIKTKLLTQSKAKEIKMVTRLRLGLSHLREHKFKHSFRDTLNSLSQPAIACSKLTIETLEQGVKYVQS